MSYPDPEEQQREGPARQDLSGDDLAGTDSAFARIVAGLRAEAELPSSSGDRAENRESVGDRGSEDDAGEDHFDPPEPPPLPIPRPRTVGGLLALVAGLLLLVAPHLLGVAERAGTPLGLFALAAGIGWLLMGLRPDPPPDGSDDGARL